MLVPRETAGISAHIPCTHHHHTTKHQFTVLLEVTHVHLREKVWSMFQIEGSIVYNVFTEKTVVM